MGQTATSPVISSAVDTGLVERVVERLLSLQRPDGGWPYEPGQHTAFTEPTCWVMLALHAAGLTVPDAACSFLCSVQQPDGGFHSGTINREANWATALAVFALATLEREPTAVQRGVDWLLAFEGRHWEKEPDSVFGHDTALRGWPWVAGAHSWIEPTSYAIYALERVGLGDHARVAEAKRMILDRALPSGGWNYGNTLVFGTELRAFPSTTAMALIALKDSGVGPEIRRGLDYLGGALPQLRTAWALGWSALAGRYYGLEALQTTAETDIDRGIARCLEAQLQPTARLRAHELAVLLMSAYQADRLPFRVGGGAKSLSGLP